MGTQKIEGQHYGTCQDARYGTKADKILSSLTVHLDSLHMRELSSMKGMESAHRFESQRLIELSKALHGKTTIGNKNKTM